MSKHFTKRLWQWHSWLGLACGLGLIVIGATGSYLVFHNEIDTWRFPERYRVVPTAAGRLPYDALWAAARRALPEETITGWFPSPEPTRADSIFVKREGEEEPRMLQVDQYTGQVRGRPVVIESTTSGWLLELHYALLGGTTGMFVAGVLAVLLLFLGASGVWLYRGFWRNFFTLRWGRSARIFFSDLHKTVGISSVAFNLILGFTGAWWNLNGAYSRWTTPAAVAAPVLLTPPPPFDLVPGGVSLDAMVKEADRRLPGYHPTYLWLPETRTGVVTFFGTVPTPNPLRGDYGSRVIFDGATGDVKQTVDIRQAGAWEKIGDSFALLHYGTFGAVFGPVLGLVVKVLWSVLGLSPGVLAVSGFLIWRARRVKRPAVKQPPVSPRAPEPVMV